MYERSAHVCSSRGHKLYHTKLTVTVHKACAVDVFSSYFVLKLIRSTFTVRVYDQASMALIGYKKGKMFATVYMLTNGFKTFTRQLKTGL